LVIPKRSGIKNFIQKERSQRIIPRSMYGEGMEFIEQKLRDYDEMVNIKVQE